MSTLIHDLFRWKDEAPYQSALAVKRDGAWHRQSVKSYAQNVLNLTRYLKRSGLEFGDRALILSRNCPEWLVSELSCSMSRLLVGGLYANASLTDYKDIFKLVEPKLLFVQDRETLSKLDNVNLSSVEKIIFFEGGPLSDSRAVSFSEALKQGSFSGLSEKELLGAMRADDPAFLILTSGTTGVPKAAMLSNDNLYFSVSTCRSRWNPPEEGKLFSFLPASHVAEQLYSLSHGIHFRWEVCFSSDITNILSEMVEVQPVVFLGTPRIWQKIMERTSLRLQRLPSKFATTWIRIAQRVSQVHWEKTLRKQRIGPWEWLRWKILDRLLLKKIRYQLGLEKAVKAVSGSAALPDKVRNFFRGLGVSIIEAYGQTESSGILAGHPGDVECAGTVGYPNPTTEFKIAEDGEILTKGRHVFQGYFRNDAATRETIVEGWLHTGDLGKLNEKGQLVFVGRKKEILKPLEGKMIAPFKIEQKLLSSPLVSQAILFGDAEKYLVAILTATAEAQGQYLEIELHSEIKKHIDAVNASLARFERVQKFRILKTDFSMNRGELTPTYKPRRHVIARNYAELLDELYGRKPSAECLENTEARVDLS